MGYHITQHSSDFYLPKESAADALAAIKGLYGGGQETIRDGSGPHYAWVSTQWVLAATTLTEAMAQWRYELTEGDGGYKNITFTGEKAGDEDKLFAAIAPFVRAGSYVAFHGEDGAHWRWYFDGNTVREQVGEITYKDIP